ncbi:hypothetical protein GCM10011391_38200 [Pullulanibacillus camelliae]|uniref:LTD domain-containing protein n=1 Tax=Pullulanibacillus camelliae TaxID=1707096 RepID=A0A8J2YN16_9BACL|nr:DUF2252 family protein [Pullulanibacillus camelliae]GGE55541.1 hypothetical protein GCM10011391_38200 [Pullulanibacillus camelliae]
MVSRAKKMRRLWKIVLSASILMTSLASLTQVVNVPNAKAANSSTVLIDEIFGGGGAKDAAPYNYDFVELYNPTDSPVKLDGWSLQYTNKDMNYKWKKTNLTGSIPAHGYYLIREHSDDPTVGMAKLPNPDASGDIDIDNHYGEAVLTENQTLLQDNTDPNKDPNHGAIADFVGFGKVGDIAYYKGSGPAPEATKKKSIERKAINSSHPNGFGLDPKPGEPGEFLGNGYDSGENSQDFTTVDSGSQAFAQNSESPVEPLIQGLADSVNNDVKMGSDTEVSSSDNTFKIHLTSGQVKDGPISTNYYSIVGLPNGLTSSAVGNTEDHSITFTIKGTSDQAVTSNIDLKVSLKASASTGAYGDSDAYGQSPIGGITLYHFTNKVTATPVDDSAEMGKNHTSISENNATFSLNLHVGQIKDGALDSSDYAVIGLPTGLSVAAKGNSKTNIVTFTLSGQAKQAVEDDTALSVVLKASAVTSGATNDSDTITGIILKRYSKPAVQSSTRTQSLIDELKSENAFDHNINFEYAKFNNMADSPADFFEGSAGLFYKDMGSIIDIPDSWLNHPDWKTWIEGDLHLTNMGFISDNNGQGLFALNDPDEAFIGPFYYDLIRFVTSLYLTRDGSNISNLSDDELQKVAMAFMDQYYHTLQSDFIDSKNIVTDYTSENLTGFVKEAMDQMVATNTQKSMLEDYTYIDSKGNRKFDISKTKLQQATFSDQKAILDHFQSYLESIDAASYKKINPNYFKIKDFAERVFVGTGSLGDKRYWLLLEGQTSSPNDDIILDIKQEKTSAVLKSSAVNSSDYPDYDSNDEAKRALTDFRTTVPDASKLTGELKSGKESYFIRPRSPYHGDYTDSALGDFRNKADVLNYVTTAAKVEANAQAAASRTGTTRYPNFVNYFVKAFPSESSWDDFALQLVHLSEDYYYQVNADYQAIKSDLTNDHLLSTPEQGKKANVLISEIYGGGGSEEGAPYNHDFVELYNPTASSVSLDGWSIQYTNKDLSAWEQTPLSGTIPAHGYYLVSEQSDDPSLGDNLPTPDASGNIDLDNHYGEVVLLSNQVMLKQQDPNQDANKKAVMDFVGYGNPSDVTYYEGRGPAPEATKKKSIGRKAINPKDPNGPGLDAKPGQLGELLGNGYNSKNNSADFTIVSKGSQADPKNSRSTIEPVIRDATPPNGSGTTNNNGSSSGSNGTNGDNGSHNGTTTSLNNNQSDGASGTSSTVPHTQLASKLPSTASYFPNIIFAGLLLVVVGSMILFFRWKKRMNRTKGL